MELSVLSQKYTVRKLNAEDAGLVYAVEAGNPLYFQFCPPAPTVESVLDDMQALPPHTTYADKFYIGFFQNEKLIAVMDLILHYPDASTAFIGFFMMNPVWQGRGIGSEIVTDVLLCLKKEDFVHARLGYMRGNEQSRHFWLKNGFVPTGVETDNGQGIVVVMQKELA